MHIYHRPYRVADQWSFFRDLGTSVRLEKNTIERSWSNDSSSSCLSLSIDLSNIDATYGGQRPRDRVRDNIIHHLRRYRQ